MILTVVVFFRLHIRKVLPCRWILKKQLVLFYYFSCLFSKFQSSWRFLQIYLCIGCTIRSNFETVEGGSVWLGLFHCTNRNFVILILLDAFAGLRRWVPIHWLAIKRLFLNDCMWHWFFYLSDNIGCLWHMEVLICTKVSLGRFLQSPNKFGCVALLLSRTVSLVALHWRKCGFWDCGRQLTWLYLWIFWIFFILLWQKDFVLLLLSRWYLARRRGWSSIITYIRLMVRWSLHTLNRLINTTTLRLLNCIKISFVLRKSHLRVVY